MTWNAGMGRGTVPSSQWGGGLDGSPSRGKWALRLSGERGGDEPSAMQAASANPVLPLHSRSPGSRAG